MSHEGEEENSPQLTTHHQRLPRRSKLPKGLPCGPPTHSSMSLSPQWIIHQGLPRKLELLRPFMHISRGNWICRHRPYISQKRRIQNFCTNLEGIKYVGTSQIKIRIEKVKIETKVTQRQEHHQNRRNGDGGKRQVLPKSTSHPKKFKARAPDGHHIYIYIYIYIYIPF